MLLLLPQHIPHNKNLSVPRGLGLKWQSGLEVFSAQKPTGRSCCPTRNLCPTHPNPPARALCLELQHLTVLLRFHQGLEGQKAETQPACSSWPFTQTLKGKALQQLHKESKPALSKTVYDALWRGTQTLHVEARTRVCLRFSYCKGRLGERAINST